jgi:thioredoxin-like negative regulator of GroEL
MDTHLEALASRHFETKFAKINVDKAKFFVNKLKIRVLPAIFSFVNGHVVDKIIGFDDMGNTDDFPTNLLERRLLASGVIKGSKEEVKTDRSIFGRKPAKNADDSDSENDW